MKYIILPNLTVNVWQPILMEVVRVGFILRLNSTCGGCLLLLSLSFIIIIIIIILTGCKPIYTDYHRLSTS